MNALNNYAVFFSIGLCFVIFTLVPGLADETLDVRIAVAESKSARILDASVIEVSHGVKARISFYEVTKPFAELDKTMAAMIRSKIVAGKYDENDPLVGRPSAWFIVNGLSDKGSVMLALGEENVIFYRGCSLFTTTAYQNDDHVFGDGNAQDAKLWKALSDLATSLQHTKSK